MYMLTVSVNGETTRTSVFASIVDATDDYATVTESARTMSAETTLSDTRADDAVATLLAGGSHSAEWEDTRPESVAVTGTADHYIVRVSRTYIRDDIDPGTFVASRAVVLAD